MTDGALGTIILAGSGVVRDGVVGELREVVMRTQTGVFNTWAAKGLFQWDNPAHLGTIGLQRDDLLLARLSDADDVVVIGVDDAEIPRDLLSSLGVTWREVATGDVRTLQLPFRDAFAERPPVYGLLAAVCQPMYADDSLPLNPARAAADLAAWMPPESFVTADANIVGFWLGRTFPTRALGSVVLPVAHTPGFAATNALRAGRINQRAVVVTDHVDDATRSVLDRAVEARVGVVVEVWSHDGPLLTPQNRLAQLDEALARGGVNVVEVAVDLARLTDLEKVAGPVRVFCL